MSQPKNGQATSGIQVKQSLRTLLRRRQRDVVRHVRGQRCALLNVDILAMLDEADGTKQHSQNYSACGCVFTLFGLRSPQPDLLISGFQVVEPDVEISG